MRGAKSAVTKSIACLVTVWTLAAYCPAQDDPPLRPEFPAQILGDSSPAGQFNGQDFAGGTPLPSPGQVQGTSVGRGDLRLFSGAPSAVRWISSLLLVLSAFWLFLHVANRRPRSAGRLPADAFQWLGKWQLSGKHQLHLVRLGSRVLLLSTADGAVQPLTEITDPAEVESLLESCHWPEAGPLPPVLSRWCSKKPNWVAEG